jgi:hypothetical protein
MARQFARMIGAELDIDCHDVSFAETWTQNPPAKAGGLSLLDYIAKVSVNTSSIVGRNRRVLIFHSQQRLSATMHTTISPISVPSTGNSSVVHLTYLRQTRACGAFYPFPPRLGNFKG